MWRFFFTEMWWATAKAKYQVSTLTYHTWDAFAQVTWPVNNPVCLEKTLVSSENPCKFTYETTRSIDRLRIARVDESLWFYIRITQTSFNHLFIYLFRITHQCMFWKKAIPNLETGQNHITSALPEVHHGLTKWPPIWAPFPSGPRHFLVIDVKLKTGASNVMTFSVFSFTSSSVVI